MALMVLTAGLVPLEVYESLLLDMMERSEDVAEGERRRDVRMDEKEREWKREVLILKEVSERLLVLGMCVEMKLRF